MDIRICLVTLNARFIHVALGLRYLRNAARAAGFRNTSITEYIIDQPVWKIAAEIQHAKPDVVGIGVYIWNRTQSLQLVELLKKQNPSLDIVLGGPEVSFETEIPRDYTVIAGEGESKWVEFLQYRQRGEKPSMEMFRRWQAYGVDLPDLHPAYIEEDCAGLQNRIVYLETSRGCPYRCSFCLSALDKKVRYFDDNTVCSQIEKVVDAGAKIVKFVDRTFNLQPKRMQSLMAWLTRFKGTSFHFEVVGDLLSADLLEFLKTVPQGMFQFEIGVQTATERTQHLIDRKQDNAALFEAIGELVRQNRVHIHCDLIFGLPGETFAEILESFAVVFALRPHELQLGFLKFLPGAPIRELIAEHEYRYQSFPPYELVSHKNLTAEQAVYLKKFAEAFDMFYNSKRFGFSIERLLQTWPPVKLFDHLAQYLEKRGLLLRSLSLDERYRVFLDAFSLAGDGMAMDLLRLDYVYRQQVFRIPRFLLVGLPKTVSAKFKAWSGDCKSPLFPFMHEIRVTGTGVSLTPADAPQYYAVVRGVENGYFSMPAIVREGEQADNRGQPAI